MFTLEDLHFESDVRETIKKLPEDLETVYIRQLFETSRLSWFFLRYERIFLRICGGGKTPNQRTAIRILQWMLVAHRPLKRCELESGIVLDERVSQISTATRPRGDVLSLCHPIIDSENDLGGYVSFIHFTAQESVLTRSLPGLMLIIALQVLTKAWDISVLPNAESPAHCIAILCSLSIF